MTPATTGPTLTPILIMKLLLDEMLLLLHRQHQVVHPHGRRGATARQEVGRHFALALHLDLAPALKVVGSSLVQHLVHILSHL